MYLPERHYRNLPLYLIGIGILGLTGTLTAYPRIGLDGVGIGCSVFLVVIAIAFIWLRRQAAAHRQQLARSRRT